MNVEEFRAFCLQKPGVTESMPFDEHTLVFKVMNKMFALTGLKDPELRINLKCDPDKALELREMYSFVQPGYHMSKKHWNTIYVADGVTRKQLIEWIDDSYNLIVESLPKKVREELKSI